MSELPRLLRPAVPVVVAWCRRQVRAGAAQARPIASLSFERLGKFYSAETLARAKVVVGAPLPGLPVPRVALRALRALAQGEYSAITLLDTFFVVPERAEDEALFFHELVHVVQWAHLGERGFVEAYAAGVLEGGYAGCPLERMAYVHEARFEGGAAPYDVEAEIRAELEGRGRLRLV
jgi:hypothetical protein